jgi:autoinducer 2-degrading protein
MHIVQVNVRVKPEFIEAFRSVTLENARHSLEEEGIARFDVLQQSDDPTRFVLLEAYRDDQAPLRHKETKHYQAWRDTVASMMAEPRASLRFNNLFPPDACWS